MKKSNNNNKQQKSKKQNKNMIAIIAWLFVTSKHSTLIQP